jgi:adenylate cyclase
LEDIFDLQDQITDKVVGIVEPSLQRSEIERSRRKRPENLDAYDLYLRALPYMGSGMPPEARIAAALLQDALKLDPDYAAAHALLSWCHERCYMRGGFLMRRIRLRDFAMHALQSPAVLTTRRRLQSAAL